MAFAPPQGSFLQRLFDQTFGKKSHAATSLRERPWERLLNRRRHERDVEMDVPIIDDDGENNQNARPSVENSRNTTSAPVVVKSKPSTSSTTSWKAKHTSGGGASSKTRSSLWRPLNKDPNRDLIRNIYKKLRKKNTDANDSDTEVNPDTCFPLEELSGDLVYHIFCYLNITDIAHCSAVCKSFGSPAEDAIITIFDMIFGRRPSDVPRRTVLRMLGRAHFTTSKNVLNLLLWSCSHGYIDYVSRLLTDEGHCILKHGVDSCKADGVTALHCASQHGFLRIMLLLLKAGANINKLTKEQKHCLHMASERGQLDIVQFILSHDGSILVDVLDNEGNTPLILASGKGHTKCMEFLLSRGSEVTVANSDGKTALYVAAENGHTSSVEMALRNGGDVTVASTTGKTPLYAATENGHVACVSMLIEHGSDIRQETARQKSPLYVAAEKGYVKIIKMLLEHCEVADLFKLSTYHTNPMMIAAKQSSKTVKKLFLQFCAMKSDKTLDKYAALDMISGLKTPRYFEDLEMFHIHQKKVKRSNSGTKLRTKSRATNRSNSRRAQAKSPPPPPPPAATTASTVPHVRETPTRKKKSRSRYRPSVVTSSGESHHTSTKKITRRESATNTALVEVNKESCAISGAKNSTKLVVPQSHTNTVNPLHNVNNNDVNIEEHCMVQDSVASNISSSSNNNNHGDDDNNNDNDVVIVNVNADDNDEDDEVPHNNIDSYGEVEEDDNDDDDAVSTTISDDNDSNLSLEDDVYGDIVHMSSPSAQETPNRPSIVPIVPLEEVMASVDEALNPSPPHRQQRTRRTLRLHAQDYRHDDETGTSPVSQASQSRVVKKVCHSRQSSRANNESTEPREDVWQRLYQAPSRSTHNMKSTTPATVEASRSTPTRRQSVRAAKAVASEHQHKLTDYLSRLQARNSRLKEQQRQDELAAKQAKQAARVAALKVAEEIKKAQLERELHKKASLPKLPKATVEPPIVEAFSWCNPPPSPTPAPAPTRKSAYAAAPAVITFNERPLFRKRGERSSGSINNMRKELRRNNSQQQLRHSGSTSSVDSSSRPEQGEFSSFDKPRPSHQQHHHRSKSRNKSLQRLLQAYGSRPRARRRT